ncbi:c-type cytochrome [Paraburkholderia sp. ZP32-5]|uniref:c-type cytochrome n=1 Tax=Paraburkholderia sp. ZP32-5 TaxID=2883245 RepID=UPI001F16D028|nr:cytochrome c [Paraburkholderia sp. ZP32-5]
MTPIRNIARPRLKNAAALDAVRSIAACAALAVCALAAPGAFAAGNGNNTGTAVDEQLAHGAYLARVGDCAACHTAPHGKPFAGGLPLDTPFGTLYSTNITPDANSGIGGYTYEDFARALREGVAKDGHRLYPAMPFPSYAKVSNADMRALYHYFMHGVPAVAQDNRADGLRFPYNVRALMTVWDTMYLPKGVYQNDPHQSVEWNRGAYLVEGLGHCSACHTPHGVFGQEQAFDANGNTAFLSGGTLAGWYAPSLRQHPDGASAAAVKAGLVGYLRSGRSADGAAFGPMTEVVDHSLQYLSDADVNAIATYLTSPPLRTQFSAKPVASAGAADATAVALRAGHVSSTGALLYLNNCSACHRLDGTGAVPAFPKLSGNALVGDGDPSSLIHIVLSGSHMPSTTTAPTPLAMPNFDWRLNDQQIADLLTFVRNSWGNHAPAVSAEQVRNVRATAVSAAR